jgi:hypothetical protein
MAQQPLPASERAADLPYPIVHTARQSVCILVGSGLSLCAVPGAAGFVEEAATYIAARVRTFDAGQYKIAGTPDYDGGKYQDIFGVLTRMLGMDHASMVVVRCVARALVADHDRDGLIAQFQRTMGGQEYHSFNEYVKSLLDDPDKWNITPGTLAMCRAVKALMERKHKHVRILTTNFDPLIVVGLKKVGVEQVHATCLPHDGAIEDGVHNPGVCDVVFLHGTFHGDTRHTIEQLTQPRLRLEAGLRTLLERSIMVVCGYSGWEDVFMRSLRNVVLGCERADVLWGSYRSNDRIKEMFISVLSAGRFKHDHVCGGCHPE